MNIETFIALNYNVIIVYLSTAAIGMATGLVGSFLVLRRQALISDAITHATLPGICIGFLLSTSLGLDNGKYLPLLLLCAGITASFGAILVKFISNNTRLSSDTAIASVMSFFYGLGLMILSIIQNMETGNKAGLESFLLGSVSGTTFENFMLILIVSALVITLTALYFKQLRLLCFDTLFAKTINMNVKKTENILLFLTVIVVCIGLKTVGLILIIALLIIPAITARLWTNKSEHMLSISALSGVISTTSGVYLSMTYNLPTGATIVLSLFTMFVISLLVKIIRKAQYA